MIVDADLAAFYGVATKELNRAVGRNIERFPEDFSFLMTTKEARNLKFNLESQVHNMVVPDMLSVSLLSRALQCSQAYYEGRELQLCRSRSYVHSSNSVNFC
jgi:hypothetical protein